MFFEKMMNAYWSKKAGKKKGFTLVEMLVVIAIIAALVSVIVPTVSKATTKAAAATNAANLRSAEGAFMSIKLLNDEEYRIWSTGTVALTGQTAVGERIVVNARTEEAYKNWIPPEYYTDYEYTPFWPLGKHEVQKVKDGTGVWVDMPDDGYEALYVAAANAVAMKDKGTEIAEGTAMNVQVIDGNAHATYNGLPIEYFAAVAEFGTANPADYLDESGIIASGALQMKEYLTNRFDKTIGAIRDKLNPVYEYLALGNTLNEMEEMIKNPDQQGDCLKCAMNSVNIGGLVGGYIKDELGNQLGYDYVENNRLCPGYDGAGGASDPCSCGHGPNSHASTSESIGSYIDTNIVAQACERGGTHTYDHNHNCSKCGAPYMVGDKHVTEHTKSTQSFMYGMCDICNYCPCCEAGTYSKIDSVDVLGALGADDLGICFGTQGCSHPYYEHKGYTKDSN